MNEKRFVKLLWIAKACLVAILLGAGFEAATTRLHVGVFDPGTASGRQRPAPSAPPLPAREFSDYSAIAQSNLFCARAEPNGVSADAPRPPVSQSVGTEEVLGLRLVGTLAGGPVASRALIQDVKTGATCSYRLGATVASATIEAIRRDAVILRCQGRPLVLQLHEGTVTNPSKTSTASVPRPEQSAATNRPATAVEMDAPIRTSYQPDYFGELLNKTTIEPYIRNSQTEGLKITGLENVPLAQIFGLRNGDIVQSINGQQLISKQKAYQVLQKAKSQSKVHLQILRDGQSKDLSFNL